MLISRQKIGDWLLRLERDMLGDVHRERRFAHAGSRGDDDHFGRVQAVGHLVEFGEPGRQAGERPVRS